MASTIRIKRSSVSGNPTTLAAGELAYSALIDNGSNGGDRLYIGSGTETNGNAANHVIIGGKYFTDKLDHSPGTLTATSAIIVDADKKIDQLLIDNLDLNGNTISSTNLNGDITITPNGIGTIQLTNPYVWQDSAFISLAEYIQDVTGGQVVDSAEIDATYDDSTGTTSLALITGSVANSKLTNSTITLAADSGTADPVALGETLTISGDTGITTTVSANQISIDLDDTTVTIGSYGSSTDIPTFTVDQQGRLTAAGSVSVATNLSIAADTGTDTISLLSDSLTFTGGEGIDTAVTDNVLTISAEDASTTNKGVASFADANFTVTSGAVVAKNITLGSSTLALGSTTTAIAGVTQLDVDNIRIDGNTISSTDVDGSIVLSPNGNGTIDASAKRITNLAEPVGDSDAATKYYVDAARSGLDIKNSVRAATITNITLSNTQTIDGVPLSIGDRVLVKNQTAAEENGIYIVASGSWTRSTDADQPAELNPGTFVFVEEGSINSDVGFVVVSDGALLIGTDPIEWTLFSTSGTLIAGNGLSKNGYTLQVNVANGIEISSDNVQLASSVAGAGLTYTDGVLDIVGTADKITVNPDSIDIASTYVGQTSIVTVGTITSGTWNATVINEIYGGTGVSSYSTGDILYASAPNTLSKLSAGVEGKVLQINASGVPIWADVDGGTY